MRLQSYILLRRYAIPKNNEIRHPYMLRKRYIIETINDLLKNTAQIVHSRHRSKSPYYLCQMNIPNSFIIEKIPPKGVSFSDSICTFAMSFRVLLYFYCNTKK